MPQHPTFIITMEDGRQMKGELYPEIAPQSVGNFIALANSGFYDGLIFHRVIPGFMIQGGDPKGTGMGGPGYCIKGEFSMNGVPNNLKHTYGVLSMAHGKLVAQGTPEELAGKLAAKGTISATAQGERNAVLAAAATVPGLTDLRVTAEKGGEVSFTAVSESGADLRGSLALAKAGCPVMNLRAESMSLEDVFLQLTEAPEETETTETKTNEQEAE